MKKSIAITFAAICLSACSSFQGKPYPVFSTDEVIKPVREKYSPTQVITDYQNLSEVEKRREYRNSVIFLYIYAHNRQYNDFLRNISMQNKGGNSAFDIAAIGLSGAVPLFGATGVKDALGAGSTFISGSQGKLNSRLFYEMTLPAIISVMEAERTKVRTKILKRIAEDNNEAAVEYGITEAMVHLAEYQEAASIERAVSILNESAAERLREADNAENLVEEGVPPAETEADVGDESDASEGDEPDTES